MRNVASDGTLISAAVITQARYDYLGADRCRVEFSYEYQLSPNVGSYSGSKSAGYVSFKAYENTSSSTTCSLSDQFVHSSVTNPFVKDSVDYASSNTGYFRFSARDLKVGSPEVFFGPVIKPGENSVWRNPVYDWGSTTAPPEVTPVEGDYLASPQESDSFYDAIKSDPEYNPATDDVPETQNEQHERRKNELIPLHGPEIGTETNPDGSVTTRFEDGTSLTTWPNGDETVRTPEGKEVTRYADGTREEWDPATRRLTTTYPDGTTRVRQYPQDGTNTRPDANTTPTSDQWTGPAGNTISRPSTEQYPETIQRPAPGTSTGSPGTPTDPPTDPALSCPVAKKPNLVVPPINFEEKFPFSLILAAMKTLGQLVGTPQAPVFQLPMLGEQNLSRFDPYMSVIRTVWLVLIGGILMPIMFYRLIKGGGE